MSQHQADLWVLTLSNRLFSDERVMAVYDQLSRSETIQAVARSRPIFGSEKSVYLFTNEALGGDIAVSEFFDFDHPSMPSYWKKLIEIGFVRTMKWSGKFGQRAKMYPTRLNGYKNDKATEFFRQV